MLWVGQHQRDRRLEKWIGQVRWAEGLVQRLVTAAESAVRGLEPALRSNGFLLLLLLAPWFDRRRGRRGRRLRRWVSVGSGFQCRFDV